MGFRKRQRGFWQFAIPAIAAVAGSVLSSNANKDAANRAAQATRDANEANLEAQREFAQHGIQWKVEDAKAAGLHPLFGAGLSGSTFSPSFQVEPTRPAADFSWLTALGQMVGGMVGNQQRRELASQYTPDSKMYDHPTMDELQGVRVAPIQGLESQVSGSPLGFEPAIPSYDARRGTGNLHVSESSYYNPLSGWDRYNWGQGGFQVIIPKTTEPQELFDDKPAWFWAHVVKQNVDFFGPGWIMAARKQFPSESQMGSLVDYLAQAGLDRLSQGDLLVERINQWANRKGQEFGAGIKQRILKYGEQFRR